MLVAVDTDFESCSDEDEKNMDRRTKKVYLAGLNLENKSPLALAKLEIDEPLDNNSAGYGYYLFKLDSKSCALACLTIDLKAGSCQVHWAHAPSNREDRGLKIAVQVPKTKISHPVQTCF